MFKPLEMVKVALQVLYSDAAKVTHVIARQGLFHLLDSQQFSKYARKTDNEQVQQLIARYSQLEQELSAMFENLSIGRKLRRDITVEPDQEIGQLETTVQRIQHDLSKPSQQLQRIEEQRRQKAEQLELLQSLSDAGSDLEIVRQFSYFYKTVGFIATRDIPRLEASLGSLHFTLVPLTTIEHRTLIVVLCAPKDRETLDRALNSAYFEPISLPDASQGSLEEIIARREQEIEQLAEQKATLSKELHETQSKVVEELQVLREKVGLALLILRAELLYGKGTRSYVILGWAPKDYIERFKEEVLRVTEGRARVEISEPEMVEEVQQGKLKIPILFNNPYLIRPFESLVFNYGVQGYREIDPTPLVAISFLLMFGMMFGDVGHGLVLFLLGYGVFKHFYQFMDYGIITMECGVSSAIFGVLYGSIFGVEHWIPALWMRPADHIGKFMQFAVGLGIFMISAGVVLNIVNSFRRKDYESGVLGHYGIAGGVFYWICTGLGLKYAIHGHLGLSTITLILLLAIPLGVIFFREPLSYMLFKRRDRDERPFPSGIGLFVMEAAIDVMDVVIRYLGNTVSFIRTAAFALAHGGLFIAVFSLAEILGQLQGGGLWYWLVIVLGNVLIIALEGLVVSIQTIRLEYYEFFSKFFQGGGERFKPLVIE
jgi:V/A-type H+/Na+-transporting ATPase subunit I